MNAPRIWVGKPCYVAHWLFRDRSWRWWPGEGASRLNMGSIFLPGVCPSPDVDMSTMDELKTCNVVDW